MRKQKALKDFIEEIIDEGFFDNIERHQEDIIARLGAKAVKVEGRQIGNMHKILGRKCQEPPTKLEKTQTGGYIRRITGSGGVSVLYFTGKEPWKDPKKHFVEAISRLDGELLIVDKFFGFGTLDNLANLGDRKIRFLTGGIRKESEDSDRLDREFTKFKRDFKSIQIRKYDKTFELHDRYIIADGALVIVGHGFQDLGEKESFMIILPKDKIEHVLPFLKEKFEERWAKAQNF